MKNFFSLILLLLTNFTICSAQQMSVESFDIVENDMDARTSESRLDQNGRKAALIKIETSEKGFAFDCGSLGVVDTNQDKVAEVWVYVPQGVLHMKINHQQLGIVDYYFEIPIKEATVYNMKLTTDRVYTVIEENEGGKFFELTTSPEQVEVAFDGGDPVTITNGYLSQHLSYGKHSYIVSASNCESYEGEVIIGDANVSKTVELTTRYGSINITTDPVSSITINGMPYGTTPFKFSEFPYGEYKINITSPNCNPIERVVTINQPGQQVNIDEQMVSKLPKVELSTSLNGADIYLNEEFKAKDYWSGFLAAGEYIVRCSKAGYRDVREKIVVTPNQPVNVKIDSPTPIYGKLRVNSSTKGVNVALDDKNIGVTPNTFSDILIGEHTLVYSKDGYEPKQEKVVIAEGKILDINITLDEIVETAEPSSTDSASSNNNHTYTTYQKSKPRYFILGELGRQQSQNGYGAMAGMVFGRDNSASISLGMYIKGISTFNRNVDCDSKCYDNTLPSYYADKTYSAHSSYTIGMLLGTKSQKLFGYFGLGYGYRHLYLCDFDDNIVINLDHSTSGTSLDLGGMYRVKSIMLSLGTNIIPKCGDANFTSVSFNIGVGVTF